MNACATPRSIALVSRRTSIGAFRRRASSRSTASGGSVPRSVELRRILIELRLDTRRGVVVPERGVEGAVLELADGAVPNRNRRVRVRRDGAAGDRRRRIERARQLPARLREAIEGGEIDALGPEAQRTIGGNRLRPGPRRWRRAPDASIFC